MNRTWKFTDLEFYALWFDAEGVGLPWPFYFTTDIADGDKFHAVKHDALLRVRQSLRGSFDEALEAIVHPDLLIATNGWDARTPRQPDTLVRLLAVRRGDRGYLVTQLPGETYCHAGGFTVAECDAVALAAAVVEALPKTDPGRLAEITLHASDRDDELDYSFGRSAVHDSFADSIAERAELFLTAPTHSRGTIDVVQGRSRFGPRGVIKYRLDWRDLADDGRYAIDDRNPPVAVPVDGKRLISMINVKVAAIVRAIKDERE